jgi:hypothetical protein
MMYINVMHIYHFDLKIIEHCELPHKFLHFKNITFKLIYGSSV